MVTTASRALAALLAAVLMTVCAPILSLAAAARLADGPAAPHSTGPPTVGFGPHTVVGFPQDSGSAHIASALAKWIGEQRTVARDLPDGYVPETAAPPESGRTWWRVAPPASAGAPDLDHTGALPMGRAPPLTTRA
ncbi:hypothetical protein HDA32_000639 [Spinactinospora alkalitolerans]|uniref:Secreted protein n=1 Tax=Spinactinospora alkalitolerans TaxID=687207 RepID=A0A852TNH2_9ACTN|nr:hypothetical protein [Spinactinospora alkalitolerans]NYE45519.1 hypothetical protein [Spinactinospora alkalitolerans]